LISSTTLLFHWKNPLEFYGGKITGQFLRSLLRFGSGTNIYYLLLNKLSELYGLRSVVLHLILAKRLRSDRSVVLKTRGDLPLRGHLAISGDFVFVLTRGEETPDILWVEARILLNILQCAV